MRILFVVLNIVGKGSYWRVHGPAIELAKRGHEVTIIATSKSSRLHLTTRIEDNVSIVEAPDLFSGSMRSGWDLWNTLHRILYLRKHVFDIVHVVESRPTVIYPAKYIRWKHNTPIILDWADWFGKGGSVEQRPSKLLRTILRPIETYFEEHYRAKASGNTVINPFLYQKARQLDVDPSTLLLWPQGINSSHFKPQNILTIRQKLKLSSANVFLAYTGSIFQDDAELMVAAFNRIHKQRPDTRLLLIGYTNRPIENWVDNQEAVVKTGQVTFEELADYVAASTIGWLPLCNSNANIGRFPAKLLDFMSSGKPVVGTNVGVMGQIIKQGFVTGNFGPVGIATNDNPDELATDTLQLLNDREKMHQYGINARHLIESKFAWHILVNQLEDFYAAILSQKKAHGN